MSLNETSRIIERDMFGALLGTLGGVLISRLLLLQFPLGPLLLTSILIAGATAGGAVGHLRLKHLDFRRIALRVKLWLVGAAAVLGVMSVLTANYGLIGPLAGTVAAAALAGGLLWAFSILSDRERYRTLSLFGSTMVVVAVLFLDIDLLRGIMAPCDICH